MLWYLFYLAFAVLLLGTITTLGVSTYSVISDSGELSRDITFEAILPTLKTQDPLTGERTIIDPTIENRLRQFNSVDQTLAVRVRVGNQTYYSHQETFDNLVSAVGIRSQLYRKVERANQSTVDISVVIQS